MTASDLRWIVGNVTNAPVHVKEIYGGGIPVASTKHTIFPIFRKSSLILERISNSEVI